MALTLEVISSHRATLGDDGVRVFTVHGGSIGRSVDNDWVLPDPERFVSARHATVQSQKGQFFIIDTSTNGVFLNDSSVPIGRGNYERLRHGDKLRIGRYELSVQMTGEDADEQAPSPQMPLKKKDQLLSLAALIQDDLAHGTDTESNLEDEVTELRDTPGGQVAPDVPGDSGDWNLIHVPGTGERPRLDTADPDPSLELAPDIDLQPAEIAELKLEEPPKPARKAAPAARRPAPARRKPEASQSAARARPQPKAASVPTARNAVAGQAAMLAAFLQAAGINPNSVPASQASKVMQAAGQLLREFVTGIMEVLQVRAELKNTLRISQTTIQPGEYNPLKFSAGVEEALRGLLLRGSDNYMPGVESVRESFRDMKHHQLAFLAAMQSSVEDYLERFDPDRLKEEFDRGMKRGPLMGTTNKIKYWELYAEFFQLMAQRDESQLPHLFAEDFARAYEDVIDRFKSKRRR